MLPIHHITAALVFAGSLTTDLLAANAPQVKITGGVISGTSVVQDGQPIHVFKGVPFAAPPVGDLRWRPPQSVIGWEGVRTCVEYAPACPQPADGIYSFAYRQQSEDCLCL
ncbi:MAG TPA: carboxylesterase family protein, partial [Planctomycetaceae bacterium]|nr:carboxylesterase family protein [Planctomycetaceae bacterium]